MKRMMNQSLGVNVMDPQGYDSFEGSQIGQSLADALGFSSNVRQALGDAGWAGADQGAILATLQQLMGREQGLREQETARDLANAKIAEQLGVARIAGNKYANAQKAAADRMLQAQNYQTARAFGLEDMKEKNAQAIRQMQIAATSADKRAQMEHAIRLQALQQQGRLELERSPKMDPMIIQNMIDRRVAEEATRMGLPSAKEMPAQIYEQIVHNTVRDAYVNTKPGQASRPIQGGPQTAAPVNPHQNLTSIRDRLWADQQSPLGTYGPLTY